MVPFFEKVDIGWNVNLEMQDVIVNETWVFDYSLNDLYIFEYWVSLSQLASYYVDYYCFYTF